MNALRLLALVSFAASSAAFASNIVLHDDFNGGVVDTSKWTIINPEASSTVSQSSGRLTTRSRGTLATVAGISAPYTVAGGFTSNSFDELFTITLRSDLSLTPNYSARQGVSVSFGDTNNTLSITTTDGDGVFTELSATPYSFNTGATYAFEVTDNGFDITVSINGNLVASASSSLALGDRIAFYSREWAFASTSIESVTITSSAVPEPASFAALAGLGVLGLAATRRRRAA